MVGESRGRRLFKDILASTPALLTPLVIAVDRLSK
jgi:polysaccharide export outer membrane protein